MKKPVGILMTDTHLERDNIDAQIGIYEQAIDLAESLNLNTVWHAGDFFESRKSQPLTVLSAFLQILDLFHSRNFILEGIPGNHDKVHYDSEVSYLDVYKYHPNLKLYRSQHTTFTDGVAVHWLPYFLESGSYMDRLNGVQLSKDLKNILITHIAVNGVRNNDGSVVENGLTRNIFKQFDNVFVGHYHDQSSIHNVHYIGSAIQKNFGENNQKGFTIVYDDGSFEFRKAIFVEYETVVIDVANTTKEQLNELFETYSESTDMIRFKFKGEKSVLMGIDKAKYERVGIDVKFDADDLQIDTTMAANQEFVRFDRSAILEEFKKFCKTESYNEEQGIRYLTQVL